jgi:hypothetical protein
VNYFYDENLKVECINTSHITLIAKKNDPRDMNDFRPISSQPLKFLTNFWPIVCKGTLFLFFIIISMVLLIEGIYKTALDGPLNIYTSVINQRGLSSF